MCGFFGILNPNEYVLERIGKNLERPARILHNRGPEHTGYFFDASFKAVFQRLAIIDVAHGSQPMSSESGRSTILYNGEIYNYKILRRELQEKGYRFKTTSDTEVLINLFEEEGIDCLPKLEGMFAFVIWQPRDKRLIMVRDANGIKPLYYAKNDRCIIFASELKALRVCFDNVFLDTELLPLWITFQAPIDERTLLKSCYRVLPGQYLEFVDGDLKREGSFFPHGPKEPLLRLNDSKKYVKEFHDIISSSIDLTYYTEVPYSFHLSGGMDTGLLLSLAKAKGLAELNTFTSFSQIDEPEELESIEMTRRFLNGKDHSISLSRSEFYEDWSDAAYTLDEPLGDAGFFAQYMINREIRKAKYKISFTGHGIDEYFGGYARYLFCLLHGQSDAKYSGGYSLDRNALNHISKLLNPYKNLKSQIDRIEPGAGLFSFYLNLMVRDNFSCSELLDKPIASRQAIHIVEDAVRNRYKNQNDWSLINFFEAFITLPTLLQMEDRASMRWSVEARVPYINYRTLVFSLKFSLPAKIVDGQTKSFVRKAFAKELPPHLVNQQHKVGRPVPVNQWVRATENKNRLNDLLGTKSRISHLFKNGYLEKVKEIENPYDRRLWGLTLLELWMRTFDVSI